MELSGFKYKRRCSIFKDDYETEKDDGQYLSPSVNKKQIINNNVIKSNTKCDESKDFIVKDAKKVSMTYSETEEDFGIAAGESEDSKILSGEPNSSAFTTNESMSDECESTGSKDSSFGEDHVEYKLGILKGIFKDAFSNGDLLEVLQDTNGLDHAMAVLLGFPANKCQESNSEKGKTDSECSIRKPSKGQKRSTSDEASPTKLRRLVDNEDKSTAKNNIAFSIKDDKSLKKLKKLLSAYEDQDLLNILESNGGCLDDAIAAAMEKFSSPKTVVCCKNNGKGKKETLTAVIVVNDDDGDDDGGGGGGGGDDDGGDDDGGDDDGGDDGGGGDGDDYNSAILAEKVDKRLKKLKKLFPAYEDQDLLNILESNGGCLYDAIGDMEKFSSPKTALCCKNSGKGKKETPTAVIVVNDDDDDDDGGDDGGGGDDDSGDDDGGDDDGGDGDDYNSAILAKKVDKRLKKLKKLFPAYEDQDLLNVLESNGGCLIDAIGDMEVFSSNKTVCGKKRRQEKKQTPTAVIVADDDDDVDDDGDDGDDDNYDCDDDSATQSNKASAITLPAKMSFCSDEDEVYMCDSDDGDDETMSFEQKSEVLSMLDSCDVTEIALIRTCSITKARKIASLRPFINWKDLNEKFKKTRGLSEELLWECLTFIVERNKLEHLVNECETISNDLRDLFEVITVESEDPSENQQKIVMKEQGQTKEPSMVAPGLKLKSYQFTGLNWLITIHKKEVNGILADEMGLGKTIQAIVFLAYLIEQGDTGPHIIVVPASTRDNWKRELEKWCPSIQCLHYNGSQEERRAIRDEVNYATEYDFQILLTTYNLAISSVPDRAFMKKCHFHYAVFDEAHMLKNMKSQRYQFLLRIKPQRMLLLTGTPIQNNLLELLSLLAFLMPTMFEGKVDGMKLLFGDHKGKLSKETAYQKEQVIRVKRIMEPFIMRRLKKDVLTHLPAKLEHIVEIELTKQQRRIYDNEIASSYKINADGKVTAPMLVGLFMKLRLSSNHPLLMRDYYDDEKLSEMARKYCRLWELIISQENVRRRQPCFCLQDGSVLGKLYFGLVQLYALLKRTKLATGIKLYDPSHRECEVNLVFEDMQVMSDFELRGFCLQQRIFKEYQLPHELVMDCAKFLYLDSVLPNMKKKGDRVLLFNQFKLMMDIFEVYLQARNHKYLRLDGSTPVSQRLDLIDQFNTDDNIFIFLLSTRAGGLGINLTSANVVILSDNDLNPHNDKQAEDRCHRLGQIREVNVYRLISRETIEEAIMKLARAKLRLHDDVSQSKDGDKDAELNDIQSLMKAVFGKQ